MNSKGQIGQILTSFPALIYVFVIMLLLVIISGFISVSSELKENLAKDFAFSYISLDGQLVTVKEVIEKGCHYGWGYVLDSHLKDVLIESFIKKYGYGKDFVLTTHIYGPFVVERWILHAAYGVFKKEIDEKLLKISASDFEKVFDSKTKNYDAYGFCDPVELSILIKNGAES